ncbi:hypothetical protein [Aquimarina litoralis]|uniref:hypothetical protein n=1 Tax=Aquimarina litoralis TaxID=584605 RepID=UPI001C59BAFE|nr:hypothetical protein [Aquimarina litoralis]MBW1298319.1 hypothetical protein [Aquimarina litoralis]
MRLRIIILCLLQTLAIGAQSSKFSFTRTSVTITTEDTNAQIKVYKGSYDSENQIENKTAILGNTSHTDSTLIFSPLIPFQKSGSYTTVINDHTFYEFTIPLDPNYKHLKVDEIYPNTATLPANFLKWYIAFSKPVNPTNIYNHIGLVDNATNTKVDRALLPLENALLSKDGTLLTLWIEPGRQKRDLIPNKRLGAVLKEGASYTLIIDKNLKDVDGIPMDSSFEYTFKVITSDRDQPNIKEWEFSIPKSNTKDPLIIHLNDVLDYGSVYNNITIISGNEAVLEGSFTIKTNENKVLFYPINNWTNDTYTLKCNKVIEDVSGNNLERLFDRNIQKEIVQPTLQRTFIISD